MKSLLEQHKLDLISRVLAIVRNSLTDRENEILTEIFIHDKTFEELEPLKLSIIKRRKIFINGVLKTGEMLEKMKSNSKAYLDLPEEIRKGKYSEGKEKKKVLSAKAKKALTHVIANLSFSMKAKAVCKANKIRTIADLVRYSRSDLIKFNNCGYRTIAELEDYLLTHDLTWKMKL